jgi:hypothetical protein
VYFVAGVKWEVKIFWEAILDGSAARSILGVHDVCRRALEIIASLPETRKTCEFVTSWALPWQYF